MKDENTQTEESKATFIPLIIAAGIAIFLLGLVIYIPLLVAGLIIISVAVLKVFKDGAEEKYRTTQRT